MAEARDLTINVKLNVPFVRTYGDLVAVELKPDRWYLVNEGRWLDEDEMADYKPLGSE